MHNSKLYSILEYLDKYQHNRLYKYLRSPYFNKHPVLIELYELLRKNIFSKNPKLLNKQKIWKNFYPDESYDDVRFRKLTSDLLKLVEGFLAQQVYEENPLHQATYLLEAVGKKKMDKLYNSAMRSARKLSDKQPYKPSGYYFYQYQIEKSYYRFLEQEFSRDIKINFEEIGKNLDWFFVAEKLKYLCEISSQKTVVMHEYEMFFIDEILSSIKDGKIELIPAISIYYQIFLMLNDTDKEDHYFKLKNLISKNIHEFPANDVTSIYSFATNFCLRKINQGNQSFLIEFFEIFQGALEKEALYVEGKLNPWHFRNIIGIALRLGKFDWVEKFIMDYQDKLPGSLRENAVTFNLATLYFYQKEYDKVIALLQEVEYEDLSYNLVSKSMLIATYYETDEIEPLDSLLESFRTYLNRHKRISQQRKGSYLNLVKFTKKLTRIIPGNKKALEKIKKDVKETRGIASEKWLLEKITDLE